MASNDLAPSEFDDLVPLALSQARQLLEPARNADVVFEALASLASRKGVDMPSGPAFEIELEELASWPPDLFLKAFAGVVRSHVYPRLPYCGEFKAVIQEELAERRAKVAALDTLDRKIRLRNRNHQLLEEAEWMSRGRVQPTQAERDAVSSIVHRAVQNLTAPACDAAADQSEQGDPRSDRAVQAAADRPTR